jgi:hypothetical protein
VAKAANFVHVLFIGGNAGFASRWIAISIVARTWASVGSLLKTRPHWKIPFAAGTAKACSSGVHGVCVSTLLQNKNCAA